MRELQRQVKQREKESAFSAKECRAFVRFDASVSAIQTVGAFMGIEASGNK